MDMQADLMAHLNTRVVVPNGRRIEEIPTALEPSEPRAPISVAPCPAVAEAPTALPPEKKAQLYRHGLLTCLLNPKIVVTYGALLPQFVDPASGHVLRQTAALGLVQIGAAASAHSLVILSATAMASVLSKRKAYLKVQRYLLGSILTALAVRLAMERRSVV